MMTPTQLLVLEWLATGETDRCSETMAYWLGFNILKEDYDHPWDPAELNRCIKLLQDVPALRTDLHRMASVSTPWASLTERWDELQNTFFAEAGYDWCRGSRAPGTAALMYEAVAGEPMPAEMVEAD